MGWRRANGVKHGKSYWLPRCIIIDLKDIGIQGWRQKAQHGSAFGKSVSAKTKQGMKQDRQTYFFRSDVEHMPGIVTLP
jgi:hypothetical protein